MEGIKPSLPSWRCFGFPGLSLWRLRGTRVDTVRLCFAQLHWARAEMAPDKRITIRGAQKWLCHLTTSCCRTNAGLVVVMVGIGLSLSYGRVIVSLFQLLMRLVLPLMTKS